MDDMFASTNADEIFAAAKAFGGKHHDSEINHFFQETAQKDVEEAARALMRTSEELHEAEKKVYELKLLPHQREVALKMMLPKKDRHVLVTHRRFGKTVLSCVKLLNSAHRMKPEEYMSQISKRTNEPRSVYATPIFNYILPTQTQGERIAWPYLRQIGQQMGGKPEQKTLSIRFEHNNSIVRVLGCTKPDDLRGAYLDGAVIDEIASIKGFQKIWDEVLEPQFSDYGGWTIFTGTVRGRNHYYKIYQNAKKDIEEKGDNESRYTVSFYTAEDTTVFSREELEERKKSNFFAYRQEYMCDWDAPIEGSFFGELVSQAIEENRIRDFVIDPNLQVFTAWDIGRTDDTAIWFIQFTGESEIRLIDYMDGSGAGGTEWGRRVEARGRQRGYRFASKGHLLPHDGDHKRFEGTARDLVERGGVGYGQTQIIPRVPRVAIRIDQTREIFPYLVFHKTNCRVGIDKLSLYRREFNETRGAYVDTPFKDGNDHCADALGCLASFLNGDTSRGILNSKVLAYGSPNLSFKETDARPEAVQQEDAMQNKRGFGAENRILV